MMGGVPGRCIQVLRDPPRSTTQATGESTVVVPRSLRGAGGKQLGRSASTPPAPEEPKILIAPKKKKKRTTTKKTTPHFIACTVQIRGQVRAASWLLCPGCWATATLLRGSHPPAQLRYF